jgi:integrase
MPKPLRIPSYRLHRASGQAVVVLNGHSHYLGKFGTSSSNTRYKQIVSEWLANARQKAVDATQQDAPVFRDLTLDELILRYWQFAKAYYVKDGRPTSEADTIRQALRFVRDLYGSTLAKEFGPLRLKAVRQRMIEHVITRKVKVLDPLSGQSRVEVRALRHGLARKFINKQVGRIKRMFAWAVEEELIPVTVHQALLRVKGIKRGKKMAREKPRVRPVARGCVEQTLPHLPKVVRTMVELQYLTDMRPQEVVLMRTIDIDMTSAVWEYHPQRYKSEHHNDDDDPDRERIVFVGPRAQELLKPWLTLNLTGYLFSPKRSEEERLEHRRTSRKTPLWPAHLRRQARELVRRQRALKDHYDVASYRRAIRRACKKAGIPIWFPNQLRHSRSTEIRKRYGLEASKACAGHREIGVTQHYAEQNYELARRVMAEIG